MTFARARKIVARRSPARRARDHAARIMRRRGDRIAMALLERDDLEPNTNYHIRSPRTHWAFNMRRALNEAFRNDPAFAAWDWRRRHAWAEAMLQEVFPATDLGAGWARQETTDFGLGLNVTAWRALGLRIARLTADFLAEERMRFYRP